MNLNDLFLKDINRPIETVIKADATDKILIEVEEYVITREIAKKIADFFAAYNDYQGMNGVWISGFFGSGKSHLLKILSYVLENKIYDGKHLGKIFAEKVEDNAILKGDILKSTKIPSESILFNIDQQAQITSKSDEDAILKVFYKVFNDHLGYFGNQPHVAEFERWLDGEGKYDLFKEQYEAQAGETWKSGRRKYFAPKTKDAITQALATINQENPDKYHNILETLREDRRASVADFCKKVADYLATKTKGFRLNFYVDEVGQYISDNTKLMLNLQTVAETLASKCKGQAWIIVTAQEDLEAIVGDDSAVGKDDFSKIQGRFKLRIPLTSANVDEVIEKRLLAKKSEGSKLLAKNWKAEQANLNTMLAFSESGVQFRKFQDEKEYVNKFPFIPYQFDLFQECIRALSKHNAFQGKHASVGERSMLGVFQQVLGKTGERDTNTLISFDYMFEGIRASMRGEIQQAIALAEKNLDDELAKGVLKTLFLLKYFPNFKTTARNISVLMLNSSKLDLKQHEKAIQTALNILESQTYIQLNGELYEFLTDDEKDIENEIKAVQIDDQEITQFFNKVIFDSIIGDNRIRYIENKQDYKFTKIIDGANVGREEELSIEVLSPNSAYYGNEAFYKSHTMGLPILLFVLAQKERLLQDIRMHLQTGKYYKQAQGTSLKHSTQMILRGKQEQNVRSGHRLKLLLKQALGAAAVYINGTKQDIPNSEDGKTKVINAFQVLVKTSYPNLRMLANMPFSEASVRNIMQSTPDALFNSDDKTISEAGTEVYNYILRRKKQSERTSITDLKEYFSKKPYGWYDMAILGLIARLHKRGKLEARESATLLSEAQFSENLLNNRAYANTLLEPQIDFDQSLIRKLKTIYQELFDAPCPTNEARDVARAFQEKTKQEASEIRALLRAKSNYPFLTALEPLVKLLDRLGEMEYNVLIQKINTFEDDLLDQKEDTLDPIKKFWNGGQKKIFDEISNFLQSDHSNLEYVNAAELNVLKSLKAHPKPYKGNTIKEAKANMDALRHKVSEQLARARAEAQAKVAAAKAKLNKQAAFQELDKEKQARITANLEHEAKNIKAQRYVGSLQNTEAKVQNLYTESLNTLQKMTATAAEPPAEYISKAKLKFNFTKSELATKEDVEAYTNQLKKEMLRHIEANRRIVL